MYGNIVVCSFNINGANMSRFTEQFANDFNRITGRNQEVSLLLRIDFRNRQYLVIKIPIKCN